MSVRVSLGRLEVTCSKPIPSLRIVHNGPNWILDSVMTSGSSLSPTPGPSPSPTPAPNPNPPVDPPPPSPSPSLLRCPALRQGQTSVRFRARFQLRAASLQRYATTKRIAVLKTVAEPVRLMAVYLAGFARERYAINRYSRASGGFVVLRGHHPSSDMDRNRRLTGGFGSRPHLFRPIIRPALHVSRGRRSPRPV